MTMLDTSVVLCPVLREALTAVEVDASGTRAELPGRVLEVTSPAELRGLLSAALYDLLHSGRDADADVPFQLRDLTLDRTFAAAVPHHSTSVSAIICGDTDGPVRSPDGEQVLVLRHGVRTWARVEDLDLLPDACAGTQVRLDVPAVLPGTSPGFFLVSGSRPHLPQRHMLRFYVHLADPGAALPVWALVLDHLEGAGIAYRAKVLSARALYPRRDALVVYLPPEHRDVPHDLAAPLAGMAGLREQTSAFARRIAPGMSVAWEPTDPRPAMSGLSFGQHRAAVVARALVTSALGGLAREPVLVEQLRDALIDPADVSRNLDSPP